jgi:hypothetical protein
MIWKGEQACGGAQRGRRAVRRQNKGRCGQRWLAQRVRGAHLANDILDHRRVWGDGEVPRVLSQISIVEAKFENQASEIQWLTELNIPEQHMCDSTPCYYESNGSNSKGPRIYNRPLLTRTTYSSSR